MRLIITGTPGTGKSEVSKILSRVLGLELIQLKKIARENGLISAHHEVDIKKLGHALRSLKRNRGYVVEGHLACELKLPCDVVVVLRCRPEVLKRRLAKRRYGKAKTEENILVEVLDYCVQRVEQEYGVRPLECDTTQRTAKGSASAIISAMKQKKKKLDSIDYTYYLKPGRVQ